MAAVPFLLCNCVYHKGSESRVQPFQDWVVSQFWRGAEWTQLCQLVFLSVRQGIYTRCSLFGVCLGSHGARFPEVGLGDSKEEQQGRTFSYLGCTLGQCESATERVLCHVESQRPRRLQTETFSWNPMPVLLWQPVSEHCWESQQRSEGIKPVLMKPRKLSLLV